MINFTETNYGKEDEKAVLNVLRTGDITQGKKVKEFEKALCDYNGNRYACVVNSGTSALHLAMMALGIGKGDEVIVPAISFIASSNSVVYTGSTPRFVDIEKDTWNIDAGKIKEKITEKTKAIMPVHLYGHPCDMDPIKEIAEEKGLYVIEDAAEVLGAEYKGKKTATMSDVGIFSFFQNKNLSCGEGGAGMTNNKELREKMEIIRFQGKKYASALEEGEDFAQHQYVHTMIGNNFRMTDLQAAIGVVQLKKVDEVNKIKREIAKMYNEALADLPLTLPVEKDYAKHVYWMYPAMAETKGIQIRIMNTLPKEGIPLKGFYYPLNKQPVYQSIDKCPIAEDVHSRGILLPIPLSLTYEQIDFIAKKLRETIKMC